MENRSRVKELREKFNYDRIIEFSKNLPTPCLIIDLDKVDAAYTELESSMPGCKIYFAMKACPLDEVIKLVASRGGNFDAASRYEMDQLFNLGITGDRISFGNTIKKEVDIKYAFDNGVRIFTSDSISDIEKLSRVAPGSKINFRILMEGAGADWPLSKKFGSHPTLAFDLAIKAKELGLIPYGIAFHVGSQQRDIGQWDTAISQTKGLFDALKKVGIKLKCINIGGGFPVQYLKATKSTAYYGESVMNYIKGDFPNNDLDIIVEPGRSLTADAGIITTEVVMVSKKSNEDDTRWIYFDLGRFSGLPETQDEAIKYPIVFPDLDSDETKMGDVIIAGNTCDSADIMYENHRYQAPESIRDGDRCHILGTGAYTASYSAVGFNGFPPLQAVVLPKSPDDNVNKFV